LEAARKKKEERGGGGLFLAALKEEKEGCNSYICLSGGIAERSRRSMPMEGE